MSLVGRLFFENQFAPAANAWAESRAQRQVAERRRTAIELAERSPAVTPSRLYARDVQLPTVTVGAAPTEALLASDCVICLAAFEAGDVCNILPCAHTFHAEWCVSLLRICPPHLLATTQSLAGSTLTHGRIVRRMSTASRAG